MDDHDFEGTLVLEKLAIVNLVEDFYDAVDSDDFEKARSLMEAARVDPVDIETVLQMMADSSSERNSH